MSASTRNMALLAGATLLLLVPATSAAQASHRLSLYLRTSGHVSLSSTRTMGGVGGGLGLRDTVGEYLLLQVDGAYLSALGNVLEVRLGAGVQRPGTWTPAALLVGSVLVGESLRFPSQAWPGPRHGPLASVGLALAPLRFTAGGTHVSLFEVGLGASLDASGTGWDLQLGVLEVGTSF